jgi:uncharacterized protein (TIGR00730 family)
MCYFSPPIMNLHSITVFCGSKDGNNPVYVQHAIALGHILAQKNITLIYGGGGKGLMGAVASATLAKGGKVIGIIPKVLTKWEQQHLGLTELHEVEDMHTRKRMLYEKSDAAVVLPGGYGTMDELFEMLTWNQLNLHDKQIFIINSGGFFDSLILHLEKMEESGFLYHKIMDKITVVKEPADLPI